MIITLAVVLVLLLVIVTFLLKIFIKHRTQLHNRSKIPNWIGVKKLPSVDITQYRGITGSTALAISLFLVLTAFEWHHLDDKKEISLEGRPNSFEELIDIPSTTIPPPPKPKIQKPQIIEVKNNEQADELSKIELETDNLSEKIPDVFSFDGLPEEKILDNPIIDFPSQLPEPIGGFLEFRKFIAQHYKYPESARRMRIEGKIFIEFVINKDGSLSNFNVIKGLCKKCDDEALRVLKIAPNWTPGRQGPRVVRTKRIVPIDLKLN